MPTTESTFHELKQHLASQGPDQALAHLAEILRAENRFHEWFEVLKMQIRRAMGLPILFQDDGDALNEAQRTELETRLLEACRKVGFCLLEQGGLREAWNYLRPLGSTPEIKSAIADLPATDDNYEQLVEVCLYEGVDPARGYGLVLERYGTCNAITTFQSHGRGMAREHRSAMAHLLLRHVHAELLENVQGHIEQQEGRAPAEADLLACLDGRDFLFSDGSYHIDTSHLSSTVQLARDAVDAESWQLAYALCGYGQHLTPELQYPGDAPFEELYVSHQHFFGALLGRERDAGLEYFAERAASSNVYEETTTAVEIYVDLLARVGRQGEAIKAHLKWIPHDVPIVGIADSPLHLAEAAGQFTALLDHYQQQGRLLEYSTVLILEYVTGTKSAS